MQEANAVVAAEPLPKDLAKPFALDIAQVRGELVPVQTATEPTTPPENDPLRIQARDVVGKLVAIPPARYDEARNAIDNAGANAVQVASHQSEILKGKLGPLMDKSKDGGPVAHALIALRDQVHSLDPSGIDFSPGTLARLASHIPFIGNSIEKYFNRFETGQNIINAVIHDLQSGKSMLLNDNRILSTDQKAWRENTLLLRKQIEYLKAVDAELEAAIPGVSDSDHQKFLQEEVLFPLRQRQQDILQRLMVNQQGVLTAEVLIRNNRELIRGVDRALFVTIDALNIAVAAAMALANQKLVLDAVDALNTTTNSLIAGTAKRLKTQGAEIQKRASSTMLASDVLIQAFKDINAAIDDISEYRRNALPQMAETIVQLDTSSAEAEKAIGKMEKGNLVAATHDLNLDVELPKAA